MTSSNKPKRIPGNTNLRYWHEETYDGYQLMIDKGPFIEQYLEKLYQTMRSALSEYARVFAFKFDLRLPREKDLLDDAMTNGVIERFKASLDAQIKWDRKRARIRSGSSHDSCVRLFWVREVGGIANRPHYHCVVFLNGDAYNSQGYIKSERDNMVNRIKQAWSSALRFPVSEIPGAVHLPANGIYHLTRTNYAVQDELFYRCSYLCKAASKHYGDGQHGCGGSRC